MKKVEVKTPLGLETFLFLDGALVRPEDLHEYDSLSEADREDLRRLILRLSHQDQEARMTEKLWGQSPMDLSQN